MVGCLINVRAVGSVCVRLRLARKCLPDVMSLSEYCKPMMRKARFFYLNNTARDLISETRNTNCITFEENYFIRRRYNFEKNNAIVTIKYK
jgi:hypothetical protein